MSEWWLVGLIIVLAFSASALLMYPLRLRFSAFLLSSVLVSVILGVGYFHWSGFTLWRQDIRQKNSQALAQELLRSVKSPQELIDKLKTKLTDKPESAKGWYLLGRLYSSQNQYEQAAQSFAKAYHFNPHEETFAVNYAYSLWQLNKRQFNSKIEVIFNSLLKNNPKQSDALAMLAMKSYQDRAYKEAIQYWQRLLELAPPESKEAAAIRMAIAKTQKAI